MSTFNHKNIFYITSKLYYAEHKTCHWAKSKASKQYLKTGTSQIYTLSASIAITDSLRLFWMIIALYLEDYKKHINKLCGENAVFFLAYFPLSLSVALVRKRTIPT
jgi:hypothetical protein